MIATGRGWDLLGRVCRITGRITGRLTDRAVDRLTPVFRRWSHEDRDL